MLPLLTRRARTSVLLALAIASPGVIHSQASGAPYLSAPATITAADYAARRAAVTANVDSGIVLAFGESGLLGFYPGFFQMPNFEYLTGFDESDAVLLVLKRKGAPASTMMFVPTQTP